MRNFAIGLVLFFLAGTSLAQILASPGRSVAKNLEKKKWDKAEFQLRKALAKDSLNVVAGYLMSLYFFYSDNPFRNNDSSYQYVSRAISHYTLLSLREKEKMKRFPLDSNMLIRLRERIDSAEFTRVKLTHTEEAYIRFLKEHPYARQRADALLLRDEVAYLDALNKNTHEAFLDFLNKYPLTLKAEVARKKYERLLYEAKTSDQRLSSYESFLHEHPQTPFRNEIEAHIFQLFTLSGEVERYLSFLRLYPSSHLVKRAKDILFHLLQEQEASGAAGLFLTDSLQNILALQESYLVPFFKNGRFGFMDKDGHEIIKPILIDISDEHKCGNITDDVIVLPDKILARNGATVFMGETQEINDIGSGFLKVKTRLCTMLIHKSGFMADSCLTDAKVLNNKFLAILEDKQWKLMAFTGKLLLPNAWDEVLINNNIVALKKSGQWHLITLRQLTQAAESHTLVLPAQYEEVKMLTHGLIWVRTRNAQGILNQTLEEIIPIREQTITPAFFGFITRDEDGFSLYNRSERRASAFEKVMLHEPWVAVRKNGAWHIFDVEAQACRSNPYDTLRFEGPFVLGALSDTLVVHFPSGESQTFKLPVLTSFIPGKDSTSFLNVEAGGKKTVYSARGKKMFTGTYDLIQYAGENFFIVHKKEKKGLIDAHGNVVLPVAYDAIGSVGNQVVSLLRSMKFGIYHVGKKKLIKPQYDKNLVVYDSRLAAFSNGAYRFITWENKPDGSIEFDDIQYWNDTTALLRKNAFWSFYIFDSREVHYPNLKSIHFIRNTPDEKLAIVRQENFFGVLSSKRGRVIPLNFSDLVNIGSEEEPLYFTEKHVEEASVFVVIYYDERGKFLRREVYQEAEDYEKIYCADN